MIGEEVPWGQEQLEKKLLEEGMEEKRKGKSSKDSSH
jgi:hypothetical protein